MDLGVLGSEGVVWGAMEGWSSDLGIWEALGLVAWLLRAPVSCFLCEVGQRAVPLCGWQQGGHGVDARGMGVTPRDQRTPTGRGSGGHSCLQASREAPDQPAVLLQQQQGSGGCAGGAAVLGWGPVLRCPTCWQPGL